MPIHNEQKSIGSGSAVSITSMSNMEQLICLKNMENGNNKEIFIGDSDVSSDNSISIDAGESMQFTIGATDDLFAISSSGSRTMAILRITQD